MRDTMHGMIGRLSSAGFQRIHRSALVNMQKVRECRRDERGRSVLVMETGDRLPVGKSYRKAFLSRFELLGEPALSAGTASSGA